VGGDTAQDCVAVMKQLRSENKGTLFAYSVEVDESEATGDSVQKSHRTPAHKRIVEEMIHSINIAADFEDELSTCSGRKTWVAVKMV
jgi:proline dehydrogenase